MNARLDTLEFGVHGRRWRAALGRAYDLAITLEFDGPQPSFFAAEPASATPLRAGAFTGSVATGASCNCATYTLAPHCHGTHTECVGHVTRGPASLAALTPVPPTLALVLSVTPMPLGAAARGPHAAATDLVIERDALATAAGRWLDVPWRALVVRTLPNPESKRRHAYAGSGSPAAYFTADAMRWVVERNVTSLVCDLPSLDRADDGGRLAAHRIFWGLPAGAVDAAQATRSDALVTELAFVAGTVADGLYLLDLHVPAFAADAAPSRPVLYAVEELAPETHA